MLIESPLKQAILNVNLEALSKILKDNPSLANEGIAYDTNNGALAHPLHRLCDGVFAKAYSDDQALEMAKIFLENGAKVNGFELVEKEDTPLIAACSLRSDALALYYLQEGAIVDHRGCMGGTALHWAAWCGRDKSLATLLAHPQNIDQRCIDNEATPIFWAVHGHKNASPDGQHHQFECARMLLEADADASIPNVNGTTIADLLGADDLKWKELFNL